MKKLIRIEQATSNKYLNIYYAIFETPTGEYKYELASRKSKSELVINNKNFLADAVRIIPYFEKDNKLFIVLIKEFRYPVNQYLYGVPAGLIDKGETEEVAAIRELKEEIGAKTLNLTKVEKASFTSAGMSDESIVCFEARVELTGKQMLEKDEDITIKVVELNELPKLLNECEFGLQSKLQLRAFYYKHKLEEVEELERK